MNTCSALRLTYPDCVATSTSTSVWFLLLTVQLEKLETVQMTQSIPCCGLNLTCHDFKHFRTFYQVPIAKMWCEVGSSDLAAHLPPLPPQLGCVRNPGVCIHPNSRIFSCLVVRQCCTLNPTSGETLGESKSVVHCQISHRLEEMSMWACSFQRLATQRAE